MQSAKISTSVGSIPSRLLRSVPPEMLVSLSTKRTAQSAWEGIKSRRVGGTASAGIQHRATMEGALGDPL